MKKIKFLILFAGIILLAGCGNKATKETPKNENNPQEKSVTEKPAVEEFAKSAIQNIQAKIDSVDISAIEVTTEAGEKLTLKIPQEGASFVKQTEQENKEMLLKEIGLFDIPKNQTVDIQYNGQTNEVMLIVVK